MKRFLSVWMLISLFAIVAYSQATGGRLSGTIQSPDGVLPGVTVVVTDDSTSRQFTAITNSQGAFVFPQLEFGTYTIRVTAPGFKTVVATEQKIDTGRDATFNATLEIGEVEEVVEVVAGVSVLTSDTPQVSNTVSPQQILSLPMIARSPLTLTTLQSGVQSNPFQLTTINGMRTTMTNITRDGINVQDTFIRANATDFTPSRPSVDDTAEFTITTANQEADQGYGGAQIRLVTPRGTKQFSGALFAYNRNSEFAANTFFNNRQGLDRPFRNRNQFGGKIGGPLPIPGFGEGVPFFHKDKATFFFSYEGIRDPVTAAATRTVFQPQARNGEFRYLRTIAGDAINTTVGTATVNCPAWTGTGAAPTCSISDILGFARAQLPNGGTVSATIDPIVAARVLGPTMGITPNFTGGDGLNTGGYRFIRRADQTRNQYASRFDVDVTSKDSILFIYNYNNEENLRNDVDSVGFTVVPEGIQTSTNTQYTAAWRRVFTSNFINEFRGGALISAVPFLGTQARPPFYLSHGVVTHPQSTFQDQGRDTKSINFQSNGDLILGKHSLKFGGQIQKFYVDAYNDVGINPTISLGTNANTPAFANSHFASFGGISAANLGTANGMMALFGGIVSGAGQSFNIVDLSRGFEAVRPIEPIRHENHSLYLADRWQVRRNLTLSLGVRWEVYPSMRLLNDIALEPVFADTNNPLPSILSQTGTYNVIGGNAGKKNAFYKTQWFDFAPNLGFAWTPDFEKGLGNFLFGSRSVIRAGYSHSFANDSTITSMRNAATGNQGLARTASSAINPLTNTTALNSRLSDPGFPIPSIPTPTFIPPPRTYLDNNGPNFNYFGTVFGIDPNIEVPRIHQYSIGWQREFFGNTAIELRYVGTKSDNLVRGVDYNQVDIFSNGFIDDFRRAQNNLRLCEATPGCATGAGYNNTITGSQQLPVFGLMPTGGLLTNATILGQIRNGTPADLAAIYIQNNLNNHPHSGNPNAVPYINFLPNPATGVADLMVNDAYYEYNSLQFEVRRRFSQGLYFQANYTFSKNLTDAIGTSQALFEPYLDLNRKELDRQRADFDQNHTFNFNGVYQLPFGQGRRFLNYGGFANKIIGGWEFSGLAQWASGAPITFVDTRGTLNRGARSGRQTVNTSLSHQEIQNLVGIFEQNGNIYWINPSILAPNGAASLGYGQTPFAGQVFFNVEPGETGTLGRTIINGPRTFNVDMALLKNIIFTERIRVQLRAEAFNVLNNVNLFNNTQLANINSTTFGQITSAGASRQMQFAFRFEF